MTRGQTVKLVGPSQRQFAHRLIDKAPDRAIVTISAETRSNEQSALMWVILSQISRAKPQGRSYPPETWKCLVLDDLGFKASWVPSLDGDGVVNTGYRSSRLTKAQMSDVIERLHAFAAENGIEIEDRT